MRFATTGPEPDGEDGGWFLFVLAIIAVVAAVGWGALGCYPAPPVNPPTCAQDPTQDWCVPPAFAPARGCTSLGAQIDGQATKDDAGVWHYPARKISQPCDGGAR